MGKPAARVSDPFACPKLDPDTGKPHVGGKLEGPGAPTVKIGNLHAARVSDQGVCTGNPLDKAKIVTGSGTVKICNEKAAREDDKTAHGGVITKGFTSVKIGD